MFFQPRNPNQYEMVLWGPAGGCPAKSHHRVTAGVPVTSLSGSFHQWVTLRLTLPPILPPLTLGEGAFPPLLPHIKNIRLFNLR